MRPDSQKRLENKAIPARNEAGRNDAPTSSGPETYEPAREVTHMPFEHDIGESAPEIKAQPTPKDNWKPIGDVAKRLIEQWGAEL